MVFYGRLVLRPRGEVATGALGKGLGSEAQGLPNRLLDRDLPLLGAHGKAVGGNELRLDTDEVEDSTEVAFEMFERCCRRAVIVEPAPGECDDHALALDQ